VCLCYNFEVIKIKIAVVIHIKVILKASISTVTCRGWLATTGIWAKKVSALRRFDDDIPSIKMYVDIIILTLE